MNLCEQCPAYDKCYVTPCGYRGSTCAALRFTCGIDSDPENQNLRMVERGKKALRGGEVMYKATYKCRMCGETFTDTAVEGETTATAITTMAALNRHRKLNSHTFTEKTIHDCPGGSIGYADFAGFRKENDNA